MEALQNQFKNKYNHASLLNFFLLTVLESRLKQHNFIYVKLHKLLLILLKGRYINYMSRSNQDIYANP